jgi:DNA polymerase type B, organellar and viral
VNNSINKVDKYFNTKKLVEAYQDFDHDKDIGVIDIETFNNNKNEAIPYAIGFKTINGTQKFYLDSYQNYSEMILDCIDKLLIKENHNFKFYAHNMSEFDGIILLKILMTTADKHNLKFKIYSDNDGKIISLDIVKKIKSQKKSIKISILDSYLLLPFGLNKLAKVFNCSNSKGIFPYLFLNKDNINYKGVIPAIEYFKDLSLEDYQNLSNNLNGLWDCKLETLQYLDKDLNILFEIMHKFNDTTFRDFKINISRIRTISGLAFLIFNSNYYKPKDKPIYFTKGKLEEFIRKGYYGGIVDILVHYTDYETYKYDVNSHYPNAMLQPMPGGKPRISTEKDLDKIFGFVEAKVMAPTKEELKVPILPIKIDGKTVLFRNTAIGVW